MKVRRLRQQAPHPAVVSRLPEIDFAEVAVGTAIETTDVLGEWLCERFPADFAPVREDMTPTYNEQQERSAEVK